MRIRLGGVAYLYMFKNGELIEVKGNKSPIGSFGHEYDKLFTSHKLTVSSNDTVYLFSDGVQDQFGGEGGKKFMIKRFREIMQTMAHLPLQDLKEKLATQFDEWKGEHEQTDDVLVFAMRVP